MQKNTDISTASLITKQKLEAAIKFIPYFETKDQENHKIDTNSLPDQDNHSEKITDFILVLEKNNFLVPFNWQEWIPEAEKIHNNPKSFDTLDSLQFQNYLLYTLEPTVSWMDTSTP